MSKYTRILLYTIPGFFFLVSFLGMLIYGYKTFYIETNATEANEYTYHFALIGEETENDYWRMIQEGATNAAKENGIYLEYVAPKKADNDQLLILFDRMISAKVDGIMIQGVEEKCIVDLIHKAVERNIPVVTIDADVRSSERKAYVGTDNFYAGQLAARTIIKNTTGKQYVGIVTGRFDAINQQERIAGFKKEIESVPRIQLVETKESNITEIGATQATYSLLKDHPEITALVGTSALDGIGMVEGQNEIAPNKEIFITAFDVLPETLELIHENKIDATIAQYPKEMGTRGVEVMIQLQEKSLQENEIFTNTKIIQKKDLDQFEGSFK